MGSSASVGCSETHARAISLNSATQGLENERNPQSDGKEMSTDGIKEFTEMKIKTIKENLSKDLNKAIDKVKKYQDLGTNAVSWNNELLNGLKVIEKTYWSISEISSLSHEAIQKYRRHAGQRLSMSKSISNICKVIIDVWKRGYLYKDGKTDFQHFEGMKYSLLILLNFSDCSPEVAKDVAGESDFLETAKDMMTAIFPAHLQREATFIHHETSNLQKKYELAMELCVFLLHNISKMKQNIRILRRHQIGPVLTFFLSARNERCRLSALSALANITKDKELDILQHKEDIVNKLLNTLILAAENRDRRHDGWSAQECVMTVRRLARNDENKKLFVQMDCLSHLVKLAKLGNEREQREAVEAIWILTFTKGNDSKKQDDEELKKERDYNKILYRKVRCIIDFLIEFKDKSLDEKVRKAIDGIWWNFRNKLKKSQKYKHIVSSFEEKNKPESEGKEDKKGHIMISYNWKHQKKVLKIRNVLEKYGYAVWMDIEQMSGSMLQTMADAVEHSHVVLICMSQNYKDSPNCRAEAEYAFHLKKTIVPLKMEKGYKPDGWLGIIAGSKLFFEFSGKYPFETKIKELIHEINKQCGSEKMEPKIDPNRSRRKETKDKGDDEKQKEMDADGETSRKAVYSVHPALLARISKWTPDNVDKWIEKYKLPKQNFGKIRGSELALLVTMRVEAPEFFYKYLQENLGISSLQTMATFIKGLEDL